ncbi:hypothetical protein AS159_05725 [Thermotoga sp. Ku-13t]|uniref:hypothetical protein n=1 Tax=Thermotoga sp. Ku-13t TaxID=1755813 RepID=UPI0013EC30B3|nr:hypothetical protein [Thermotoga sp. Ku-13t]KAF2957894.1 hypothetical protein AS159_05725 [Thermotoga sp. Ku-13t]
MQTLLLLFLPVVLLATSITLPGQERAIALFKNEGGFLLLAQEDLSREIFLMLLDESLKVVEIRRVNSVKPERINDAALVEEGLIVVGYSLRGPYHRSVYLCWLDADGKLLRQRTLDFPGAEAWAETLVHERDAFYVAGGYNTLMKSWFDALLVRLDRNFDVVWHRTIGGLSDDWFHRVRFMDSNLLCIGSTESRGKGKGDMLICMFDREGRKIFERTFGERDWDKAIDAVEFDGKIYMLGWTTSYAPYRCGMLLQLSSRGKILNQQLLDLGSDFSPSGLIVAEDHLIVYGTL